MAKTEKDLISETIEIYFASMYESSADKVKQVFHEDAKITGYMQNQLMELSVLQFADSVAGQLPSAAEKKESKLLEIASIEVAGATAVARVRDGYLGLIFLDTLSLLKIGERWVIYNKLFHIES
ncbi:MAG: nuclear transport factor 2 family protein [Gammaproteobacteria bacterium]|jgi:hypothetical protein|nr:nuclear transport factor 2 family protein [Gammaproteobacteria bacterium]MBT5203191.1 nuclear transport factor 2 family protein [Gammaproteobacteria bacterium]MBT5600686.1 nuclear transport factor 2 family protein [Gammaproteobacteria bacterium]MBT6244548.1 nuclear transport factor 2 family protein [Gammaproteobacteria bacterium]